MSRRSIEVATHLRKARESALLAVEIYNRPSASFRSGGYIVLMCIAWTSLFHAIFFKRKEKPFYRRRKHQRHFEIVDGDKKAWELTTCLQKYWLTADPPERSNIEFFIRLRNKIEHRSMPALDMSIFGECQALLFNFEDVLTREFSEAEALNESLAMSLQFSMLRDANKDAAVKKLLKPGVKKIVEFIDQYRSTLSTQMLQDPKFSYKVFLIPKPANRLEGADVAVEFVKFNSTSPEEMDKYQRLVTLIKPTTAMVTPIVSLRAGGAEQTGIRIVTDQSAPAVRVATQEKDYPFRQTELRSQVKAAFPQLNFNQHHILAIRSVYEVDGNLEWSWQPQFSSRQYSEAFLTWLIERITVDSSFLEAAREEFKNRGNKKGAAQATIDFAPETQADSQASA